MRSKYQLVANRHFNRSVRDGVVGCMCRPRKQLPPRVPCSGPQFTRPAGSRDPNVEHRLNIENGMICNWGC